MIASQRSENKGDEYQHPDKTNQGTYGSIIDPVSEQ
jgi:hypothetical protein